MNSTYSCPHCHDLIIKSYGAETKVRGKVLIIRNEHAFVVCRGCDHEVMVPLTLDKPLMKSLTEKEPALYITKK